jgi:hypothetical protein
LQLEFESEGSAGTRRNGPLQNIQNIAEVHRKPKQFALSQLFTQIPIKINLLFRQNCREKPEKEDQRYSSDH